MHAAEITKFYQDITHVLFTLAKESIIGTSNQRKQSTSLYIPGWNDQVKQAHSLAKNVYPTWRTCGKPLHGFTYEKIGQTKKLFKAKLRQCKYTKETNTADAMAEALYSGNKSDFWKKVRAAGPKNLTFWLQALITLVVQQLLLKCRKINFQTC